MSPRSRPGKSRGLAGSLFLLVLVAAVLVGGWLWLSYRSFADAPLASIEAGDTLLVERGDSLDAVLRRLQTGGAATGDRVRWQVLARQLGAAGRLQVGEYALKSGIAPRELLLAMRDGKVTRRMFTIVEGWNMRELRAALSTKSRRPLKAAPWVWSSGSLRSPVRASTTRAQTSRPRGPATT